ncbi:putative membrane protein [Wickerhamomyces ciferrii]|uniref:Membrane protein n=1 Tax=Wickerhamomyces ciferrii (strain ATCC 14091 / BCRC 22168 / CBS 111 / JCM 3599 / NBRC 0793 / NRRL Y-1031 F-60-10) TaxID=1206466 RepID=K0KIN0_WICCF|nr:uncharacterized protein BN7_2386 [Wickerhamomyces ciferrii]CCH42841.1 putative membrane protein [Wickerhamomyces ciferrii]
MKLTTLDWELPLFFTLLSLILQIVVFCKDPRNSFYRIDLTNSPLDKFYEFYPSNDNTTILPFDHINSNSSLIKSYYFSFGIWGSCPGKRVTDESKPVFEHQTTIVYDHECLKQIWSGSFTGTLEYIFYNAINTKELMDKDIYFNLKLPDIFKKDSSKDVEDSLKVRFGISFGLLFAGGEFLTLLSIFIITRYYVTRKLTFIILFSYLTFVSLFKWVLTTVGMTSLQKLANQMSVNLTQSFDELRIFVNRSNTVFALGWSSVAIGIIDSIIMAYLLYKIITYKELHQSDVGSQIDFCDQFEEVSEFEKEKNKKEMDNVTTPTSNHHSIWTHHDLSWDNKDGFWNHSDRSNNISSV